MEKRGLIERLLIRLLGEPGPYKKGRRINDIMGREDVTQLYLRRFILLKNRFFRLYLHKIVRSDDDADPHDHPWGWATIILRGGYVDERWDGGYTPKEIMVRGPRTIVEEEIMTPGTFRRRRPGHLHRLRLFTERRPTWTLVFTTDSNRPWGFVTADRGWIQWEQYLKERRHPQVAE